MLPRARRAVEGEAGARAAALAALALSLAACSAHPGGGVDGAIDAPVDALPIGDAYVDLVLGTDDLQHGRAPGAGAFKTITYALAHASATIYLAPATYDHANGETFPLALSGTQNLTGEPGFQTYIVGDSGTATITLGGSANQLNDLDVSAAAATGTFNSCLSITASGAHVVTGVTLHDCFSAVEFAGHGGVTFQHVTVGSTVAGNCLNQVGDHVHLDYFACRASNDWVFGCGVDFTGCYAPVQGRQAACTADTSHFGDPCL